jgi:hypothetical protein
MADYKKIAEEALKKANASKGIIPTNVKTNTLNESILYPEGLKERMHPILEKQLVNQETSLGHHPIFPEGDEHSFEQKIMGERFNEVAKRYKTAHETDSIDDRKAISELMPLVKTTMHLEESHRKELEDLAVKMIREEYDMDENVVEIEARLTPHISIEGTKINPTPVKNDMEFKNHDEMIQATAEVYKRRFVNAMIQGAAKKCNHMFHMVEDELADLDPKLSNLYKKMMSTADYMYYIIPKMENGIDGGVVRVEFPTHENPKVKIIAEAMVFPVLIHELVKGVMEVLSARGLPKKKMGKFVIDKADYLSAEPWDMRIGPALWSRFSDTFEPGDFKYKHHVWNELVALPPKEFNTKMKEIMAGTKEGKKIINTLVEEIKLEMKNDDFNDKMGEINKDIEDNVDGFDWEELMGPSFDDEDLEDGFEVDDLF